MLYNILGGITIFGIGIAIGLRIHNKRINYKIAYMHSLADEIKNKNNTMVENLAKVYEMNNQNQGEFTEVDAMLMNMWID